MTESEKRIPPFGLRLPSEIKERVQNAAKANNRSMNAEIIARLEASFVLEDFGAWDAPDQLASDVAALKAKIEQMRERREELKAELSALEMGSISVETSIASLSSDLARSVQQIAALKEARR